MGAIIPCLNACLRSVVRCVREIGDTFVEYCYYICGTVPEGFEPDDVRELLAITHLSKRQIFRAFRQFVKIAPAYFEGRLNPYLRKEKALELPMLRYNPFADRMVEIFSSYDNFMTFDDFLSMVTVLSPKTSFEIKTEYAFMIYDMDDDDLIGLEDMHEIMKRLDRDKELTEDELEDIINLAMVEGDIDGNKYMTYTEFLHSMCRMPDFMRTFVIDF